MNSLVIRSLFTAALAVILFSIGCASAPQPDFSNMPGKFNLHKTQNDLYTVTYTGTTGMTHAQAENIVGQRISTVVLNEGYRYFIVLNKNRTWVTRPGDPNYPPGSVAATDHHVPKIHGDIRLFKKEPKIQTMAVFDAEQTQQNLKAFH
ncbi:MAG: hypothetical protein QM496_10315 [Verrucomicrobiota bacterium]